MKRLAKNITIQNFINDFINNEISLCSSRIDYPNVILKVEVNLINEYLQEMNSVQLYSFSFDFDSIIKQIKKSIKEYNEIYNKNFYVNFYTEDGDKLIIDFNS